MAKSLVLGTIALAGIMACAARPVSASRSPRSRRATHQTLSRNPKLAGNDMFKRGLNSLPSTRLATRCRKVPGSAWGRCGFARHRA